MSNYCNVDTEHDTMTAVILCDAGNVSFACSERLAGMIQWPEITDTDPKRVEMAKLNLRSRFDWKWRDIDDLRRRV